MVSSLFAIAQRACIRNVADIYDVSDLRYEILQPILKRIGNPAQLRQIEVASPHIGEDDAELWKSFIRRDISDAERKLASNTPRNPCSWWKVYRKLKREEEVEKQAAEEKLKAALNKHKVGREANKTNIVHAVIPTGEKRSGWGTSSAPRAAPAGAQALKNARTAQQQLTILKRQTASRQAGRSVAQSVPSHQLQQMRGRVQQAPASMVRQYAGNPTPVRPPAPVVPQTNNYRPHFVPKPQTHADRALTMALQQTKRDQERKEQRLRNLTGASAPASSSEKSAVHSQGSAPQARKRPAYDPFLPAKRRKP